MAHKAWNCDGNKGWREKKTKTTQFQDVAGALQEFKTYLFMKPGSAFCTIVHLPMKFMAITEATKHLQGRLIGFIGDRTVSREPTPVLFPSKKTWERVTEKYRLKGRTYLTTMPRMHCGVDHCGSRKPSATGWKQPSHTYYISLWYCLKPLEKREAH